MTPSGSTLDAATMTRLMARFGGPEFAGLMLMGSRAQGSAGPYSDVDLVRLARHDDAAPDDGTHLVDDWLVVVSTLTPAKIARIFTEPDAACDTIMGLRGAQLLVDPAGQLAALQRRAHDFVWDVTMQAKANRWAAAQLVGLIEEAHKGMEGLRRNDIGRLLNARFGLSWLLSSVVKVQRGVLLTGDNAVWDAVNHAVGETTLWVKLRRAAFGIEEATGTPPSLRDQVTAGLRLYVETVALMVRALPAPESDLILATVRRIKRFLAEMGDGR